ncbi:MAG: ABC transporter permease subunit [Lachnospiraceae bacterium]|nr:ABC transporter permease subunit [Lachnospiraceae bacterium]
MRKLKRFIPFYIMMIPGLTYLFINNYIPLTGLQLAFKKFKYNEGIFNSPWVGMKNFSFLFKTNDAWVLFRNTLGYNLLFLVINTVLAIAVAILLNEVRSAFIRKMSQTVVLIPFLLSYVVISYIVYALLGQSGGMVNNSILKPLGMEPVSWYTKPKYWPLILTLVQAWKAFGYNSIIYYATIIGFDKSLYEAAAVDGAGVWKRILFITMPMLKATVITLTLMSIGRMFYSDFGLFYQVPMNSGMLQKATTTIDTYVYRGLMESNDIGRAAAAGFLQSILGFVTVLTANTVVRKIESENALF